MMESGIGFQFASKKKKHKSLGNSAQTQKKYEVCNSGILLRKNMRCVIQIVPDL